MMEKTERRKDRRITIATVVKVWLEDLDDLTEYMSENLSAGGIFIKTDQPLPVGSKVSLEFSLFEGGMKLIEAEGIVVRIMGKVTGLGRGESGMAVEFTYIDPESKALIDNIVNKSAEYE